VTDGVTLDEEPLPASETMQPALEVRPFYIVSIEQIVGPLGVAGGFGISGPDKGCLAAELELGLVT